MDGNFRLGRAVRLADPKNFSEREEAAKSCADAVHFTIPMLIDDMDDHVAWAYGGYPDRLYLVGEDGNIAYRGGPGPGGFRPGELEEILKDLLRAKREGRRRRVWL